MKHSRSLLTAIAALALALLATSAFASKYSATVTGTSGLFTYWEFSEATTGTQTLSTVPTGNYLSGVNPSQGYNSVPVFGVPTGIDGGAVHLHDSPNLGASIGGAGNGMVPMFTGGAFQPADLTVEFWVKPIGTSLPAFGVFGGSGTAFEAYWNGSYKPLDIGFGGSGGGVPQAIYGPTYAKSVNPFVADQWNFVVFTFTQTVGDPTQGTATYYVNGVNQLTAGSLLLTSLSRTAWSGISVWAGNGLGGDGVQIEFDELAIFNRALTQQEILDEFNAVPEPGMLSLLALGGAFMVWRRKVAAKRA